MNINYEDILRNAPFAYAYHKILLDNNGNPKDFILLDLNESYEKITGVKSKHILNKKASEFMPNLFEKNKDLIDICGEVSIKGINKNIEKYYKTLDKWYYINIYSNKKYFFSTIFIDITELKKMEIETNNLNEELLANNEELIANNEELESLNEELNENYNTIIDVKEDLVKSEQRYKAIITVSNTGAWEYDIKKDFLWCSPEYFLMLGYNPNDFLMNGESNLENVWINLIYEADKHKASNHFSNYLSGGSDGIYENYFRMKHKNGNLIWIWSRGKTLRNKDGSLSNITVGTHINITKIKEAQEMIQVQKTRLENIINAANAGTWEWNLKTNENIINDKWANILGYEKSELEENLQAWKNLIHKDDLKKSEDLLYKHINGEIDFYQCEFRMRHKKGHWVWILDRGKIVCYDEKGAPLWFFGTHIDITRKKEAEKEIYFQNESQKLINTIISELVNVNLKNFDNKILFTLKKIGEFISADRSYLFEFFDDYKKMRITHEWCKNNVESQKHLIQNFPTSKIPWKKNKLLNKEIVVIKNILNLPKEANIDKNTFLKFNLKSLICVPLYKENIIIGFFGFDFLSNETGVFDNSLNILNIISNTFSDAFVKLDNEKKLIESKNKAEEANKVKNNFLAKVSHELRTPMNGIIGSVQLCEITDDIELIKEYIHIIKKSAYRLMPIIDDVLDISKIESNKIDLYEEEIELNSFLLGLVHQFEIQCKEKKLDFIFNKNIRDNLWIISDKTKLSQIISNVIGNAVKFTDKGKVEITIEEKIINKDKIRLYISVRDTGIVIKEEFKEKVFIPFEQSEKYITRKYGGAGLGLSITKEILDKMNGVIYFNSKMKIGTEFNIEIEFFLGKGFKLYEKENLIFKNNYKQKIRILVAEDDETSRKIIQYMFREEKIYLDFVENGRDAILYYDKNKYDLILMDLQMPLIDGITASGIIREKEKSKSYYTPIIALTGHAYEYDKEKCLKVGINEFITKPFKIEYLKNIINKILENNYK